VQEAYDRHGAALRAYRERPCHRRTPEKDDQLAPFHPGQPQTLASDFSNFVEWYERLVSTQS